MKKHSSKKTFLKILLILSLIAASVTILSFLIDMKNSSPDNVSINITPVELFHRMIYRVGKLIILTIHRKIIKIIIQRILIKIFTIQFTLKMN